MGLFIFIGSQLISLYSVWDDEANTALFAQSVHETGDTSAIRGNNIIAFRGGSELNEDLKARYVSPLQYYFLAPFISSTEPQPIRAKIPFFCLSILSLFLIYRRLYLQKLSTPIFLGFLFVTTGLVSFVLFSIQCRY